MYISNTKRTECKRRQSQTFIHILVLLEQEQIRSSKTNFVPEYYDHRQVINAVRAGE